MSAPVLAGDLEHAAEAVERVLARLAEVRPHLAERIARAENIVVAHLSYLSCRRQRLIRVRARDGRARFLISGSKGAVYVVNPGDWSCNCPDHHMRGAGCKHALASWAPWRAGTR